MDEIKKDYSEVMKEVIKKIKNRGQVFNRRKKLVTPRKHHLTPSQITKFKNRFEENTKDIDKEIKVKAGPKFFNPFRRAGIYYGCVQALYCLGANEWHPYIKVYNIIQENMSKIVDAKGRNSWQKFVGRQEKSRITGKDEQGKIHQNMRVMQRLGGIHPYGYKLQQLFSCIDILRTKSGKWLYRLNTSYKKRTNVKPLYDFSAYKKPKVVKIKEEREVENIEIEKVAD